MNYKLINRITGEETMCSKVVIDGFDYYFSGKEPDKNTKPCYCYNSIKNTWDEDIIFYQGTMPMYHYLGFKIIVATNNPSIDLPKVADIVVELSHRHHHYSERDMIEFAAWLRSDPIASACFQYRMEKGNGGAVSTEELLQVWKDQKLKTVYYE